MCVFVFVFVFVSVCLREKMQGTVGPRGAT